MNPIDLQNTAPYTIIPLYVGKEHFSITINRTLSEDQIERIKQIWSEVAKNAFSSPTTTSIECSYDGETATAYDNENEDLTDRICAYTALVAERLELTNDDAEEFITQYSDKKKDSHYISTAHKVMECTQDVCDNNWQFKTRELQPNVPYEHSHSEDPSASEEDSLNEFSPLDSSNIFDPTHASGAKKVPSPPSSSSTNSKASDYLENVLSEFDSPTFFQQTRASGAEKVPSAPSYSSSPSPSSYSSKNSMASLFEEFDTIFDPPLLPRAPSNFDLTNAAKRDSKNEPRSNAQATVHNPFLQPNSSSPNFSGSSVSNTHEEPLSVYEESRETPRKKSQESSDTDAGPRTGGGLIETSTSSSSSSSEQAGKIFQSQHNHLEPEIFGDVKDNSLNSALSNPTSSSSPRSSSSSSTDFRPVLPAKKQVHTIKETAQTSSSNDSIRPLPTPEPASASESEDEDEGVSANFDSQNKDLGLQSKESDPLSSTFSFSHEPSTKVDPTTKKGESKEDLLLDNFSQNIHDANVQYTSAMKLLGIKTNHPSGNKLERTLKEFLPASAVSFLNQTTNGKTNQPSEENLEMAIKHLHAASTFLDEAGELYTQIFIIANTVSSKNSEQLSYGEIRILNNRSYIASGFELMLNKVEDAWVNIENFLPTAELRYIKALVERTEELSNMVWTAKNMQRKPSEDQTAEEFARQAGVYANQLRLAAQEVESHIDQLPSQTQETYSELLERFRKRSRDARHLAFNVYLSR